MDIESSTPVKSQQPRELRRPQAFWIAGTSAAAAALVVALASEKVPWLIDKIWSQEAAGWASASATVLAVWVALSASEREHVRALRLRDDEWARADAEQTKRTATLAHAFDRELYFAAGDLDVVIRNTSADAVGKYLDDVRRFIVFSEPTARLSLMTRFADDLSGFSVADATDILNAISVWEPFRNKGPRELMDAPDQEVRELAKNIHMSALLTKQSFQHLKAKLQKYLTETHEISLPPAPPISH